jgi:hypothetical protein
MLGYCWGGGGGSVVNMKITVLFRQGRCCILKMEATGSFRSSVLMCQTVRRHIQKTFSVTLRVILLTVVFRWENTWEFTR